MRIAIVSPYDLGVFGGVQAHVGHLARELQAAGDDILLVAPGQEASPDRVTVGRRVQVPFNGSVAPISLSPLAGHRTLQALRAFRAEVVHVHEPVVPMVSLAATLRAEAPVVGTFHAWSDRDRAYRLVRPVANKVVGRLAARIAVSPAAAAYHAAALGLHASAFRIIPNGVVVQRFADAAPLPEVAEASAPAVLAVGRLERRKGVEHLVRALLRVKTRRPDVRLIVAGDGPERPRLERLVPTDLRDDIRFLGRVSDDELAQLYRSCDLFVAPALGGESFGIVLLEAMAAGCPVVASDLPGYRTVVRDGVDGRLVPPGDVGRLADVLDSLLANPSLRNAMAAQGRQTAADHDWPVVARRIREVYEDVVG